MSKPPLVPILDIYEELLRRGPCTTAQLARRFDVPLTNMAARLGNTTKRDTTYVRKTGRAMWEAAPQERAIEPGVRLVTFLAPRRSEPTIGSRIAPTSYGVAPYSD